MTPYKIGASPHDTKKEGGPTVLVKLYLDDDADADVIAAITAMPRGERSERIKSLLRLALAGTGGLLVRIEALERRVNRLASESDSQSKPHLGAMAMQSLLEGLDGAP